ncbi:hypothetical protein BC829DRAFT_365379, partial [Chytridium lagenaria]
DSALPTGGFIASSGLEAAVHMGHIASSSDILTGINDIPDLREFIVASVNGLAGMGLPYTTGAWKCTKWFDEGGEVGKVRKGLVALDVGLDAMVGSNHVARRAYRAQGAAYVSLLEKGLLETGSQYLDLLQMIRKDIRGNRTPGHLPVTFGMTCFCLGLSLETTQYLLLFQHARSIISAAVRLNLVGPYAGQKLLLAIRPDTESILQSGELGFAKRADGEAYQCAPVVDLVQGMHDQLYSRLFNS